MIANLILAVNVVMPLFLEMLLGNFLKRMKLIDNKTAGAMNKLIFKCFLPILLFYNIYNTDLDQLSSPTYLLYGFVCAVSMFLILMILVPIFEKDRKKCGAMIQAGFRSNFVLFGLPLAISLVGDDHAGPVSLLIAVIVPTFNILAVITLERFRGQNVKVKNVLKGIATNPLVLASLSAILVKLIGIQFPSFLESTISGVSKIATPLALIVLGAEFRLDAIKEYWKHLIVAISTRLIIFPVIFLTIGAMLGFRGDQFVALMVMLSSPVAVSSYTMAESMDSDGVLASQVVFYSTAFSIVTLFCLIFVTKTLGMF